MLLPAAQSSTLNVHLCTELLQPVTTRLVLYEALLYDVPIPGASSKTLLSSSVSTTDAEPPACGGLATTELNTLLEKLQPVSAEAATALQALVAEAFTRRPPDVVAATEALAVRVCFCHSVVVVVVLLLLLLLLLLSDFCVTLGTRLPSTRAAFDWTSWTASPSASSCL